MLVSAVIVHKVGLVLQFSSLFRNEGFVAAFHLLPLEQAECLDLGFDVHPHELAQAELAGLCPADAAQNHAEVSQNRPTFELEDVLRVQKVDERDRQGLCSVVSVLLYLQVSALTQSYFLMWFLVSSSESVAHITRLACSVLFVRTLKFII